MRLIKKSRNVLFQLFWCHWPSWWHILRCLLQWRSSFGGLFLFLTMPASKYQNTLNLINFYWICRRCRLPTTAKPIDQECLFCFLRCKSHWTVGFLLLSVSVSFWIFTWLSQIFFKTFPFSESHRGPQGSLAMMKIDCEVTKNNFSQKLLRKILSQI